MFLPKRLKKLFGFHTYYSSSNLPPPPLDKWISYASNCEDVYLRRCFTKPGFYIDVGANHPVEGSVTKHFYDHGWHGINIEPHNQMYTLLERDRKRDITLNIAAASSNSFLNFYEASISGYSSLNSDIISEFDSVTKIVKTETLDSICKRLSVKDINFLKIDVEGFEKDVLSGFDLSYWQPAVIVIEATCPGTSVPCYSDWEHLITSARYTRVLFDGVNAWYVASNFSHLKEFFVIPPNVWDNFVTYDYWRCYKELERLIS